jgi:uncharacterized membrane protein YkvA (DUF1232 family)
MSDDKMQYPERASDVGALMGWLKDFFGQFRLGWELLWDDRVPFVTKIIPILTLVYVISPIDLIPGLAFPGVGALDDMAIFLIGLRLFIDVSPPALVAKHQEDLRREMAVAPPEDEDTPVPQRPASSTWTPPVGQVIDLEAKIIDDTKTDADAADAKPKSTRPHVW